MISAVLSSIALLSYILAASLSQQLNSDYFHPDLMAIFVFHVALTRKPLAGLLLSIVLAILFAPFNHAPLSFFLLQAIFLLLSVRILIRFLNLIHPLFVAVFIFFAEILLQIILYGLLAMVFDMNPLDQPHLIHKTLAQAGSTAVLSPLIILLVRAVERRMGEKGTDNVFLLR